MRSGYLGRDLRLLGFPTFPSMRPERMRSGYVLDHCPRQPPDTPFNEAGAHALRISPYQLNKVKCFQPPSMRPERMRSGYEPDPNSAILMIMSLQ